MRNNQEGHVEPKGQPVPAALFLNTAVMLTPVRRFIRFISCLAFFERFRYFET